MLKKLTVRRLGNRTFFKLFLIGNAFTLILIWGGLTMAALVGAPVVAWEDEYVTGRWTTIVGPVVVVFAGLLFCIVQMLLAGLGLMFLSRFTNITIGYVEVREPVEIKI